MKQKLIKLLKKNKKALIIASIGCLFMLAGYIVWDKYYAKLEMFKKEEKEFLNSVETYYSYRNQYLPEAGETREITLEELYLQKQINALHVPGSKKMCNPDSWVRVYNDNGEYKYTVYLECGKYKSKVDSKGPVITLNGKKTIYLLLNSKYEELGVKKVEDNEDGEIDLNKVIIDSSKVNTSKVGEYDVTYTVTDSSLNETVVKRKIKVTKGLTATVKDVTSSTDGYYISSNNYLLFSGMLWRIVRVNEDGTIKIILDANVNNLRVNSNKYENGNVDKWLNNVFYEAINNKKYLVDSNYCVGTINSLSDYQEYCSTKVKRKVGLLDISEYYRVEKNVGDKLYLIGNSIGDKMAEVPYADNINEGISTDILAPIRPVITLSNNLNILSGDGTVDKPYKLNDYSYADKGDYLNTRLIGEYIEYSGFIFKIIGVDKDSNVRVIMDNVWTIQPDNTQVGIISEDVDNWVFNTKEDKNIGYIINNEYIDYIDEKSIIQTEYEIPTNEIGKDYDQYKTKKVKAKILLPKTYELFAGCGNGDYGYVNIDVSTNEKNIYFTNATNNNTFEFTNNSINKYGIKALITLKKELKISSGNGTINKPYKLK